jgi:hypothetical protein
VKNWVKLLTLVRLPDGSWFLNRYVGAGNQRDDAMPIEQGAVKTVLLEHEFKFLAPGFVDLSGSPSQQFCPRHEARLPTHTA